MPPIARDVPDMSEQQENQMVQGSATEGAKDQEQHHAYDKCKQLVRDMDPEYRRRYFSEAVSPDVKMRTNLVQQTLLSFMRKGPIRDTVEQRANRRADADSIKAGEIASAANHRSTSDDPKGRSETNPSLMEMNDIFSLANDDVAFSLLCLLFDKDLEDRFAATARRLMEAYHSDSPTLNNIVRDVFLHANARILGISSAKEHAERELELTCLCDVIVKARESYGLTPYSELRANM